VVSENKDAEDSIDEEDIVRFEYEGTLMMEVSFFVSTRVIILRFQTFYWKM
jgi:uncharacterized protein YkuJ